jgi:hypothetical protein
MADSLRTAVLSGVAEQRQAASSVRVGLASDADRAIAGLSDKAVVKRAFDTAGYTAAHPRAIDFGVQSNIVGAANIGMLAAAQGMIDADCTLAIIATAAQQISVKREII